VLIYRRFFTAPEVGLDDPQSRPARRGWALTDPEFRKIIERKTTSRS